MGKAGAYCLNNLTDQKVVLSLPMDCTGSVILIKNYEDDSDRYYIEKLQPYESVVFLKNK